MAVWLRPADSVALPGMSRERGEVAQRAEFDRLFQEFADSITGYLVRMVGDPDRAADIAQDTFIKAYRRLPSLNDVSATRSWIFRIATNTAIDEMRRRRWSTPMGPDEERHRQRPDAAPGPEAQVMAASIDERLQRALLRLKPNHRQCLLLSDLEDMSAVQIGEVMELSPGAVRTLLCRARGEMRRLLAAEGLTR